MPPKKRTKTISNPAQFTLFDESKSYSEQDFKQLLSRLSDAEKPSLEQRLRLARAH